MRILYTLYHGQAFPWAIIHKLTNYADSDADLLLGAAWNWCAGSDEFKSIISKFSGVFGNVYKYDISLGVDPSYDVCEKTEQEIIKKIDSSLDEQGCNLADYEYVFSHTDGFDTIGIYFSLKHIHFYWFETWTNGLLLRNEEWVSKQYRESFGYRDALLKHKTIFGKNAIQSYVVHPQSNYTCFDPKKIMFFDPVDSACMLDDYIKNDILCKFEIETAKLKDSNICCIYLQSEWWPGQICNSVPYIKSRFSNTQLYGYYSIQVLMDYYSPDDSTVVLKTHPSVPIDSDISDRYFNGAYAFPSLFTVVLVNSLLSWFKPKYRILLSSTANKQVVELPDNIECPGVWLFSAFTHKYFSSLAVLNNLQSLYSNVGERFLGIGLVGDNMSYNDTLLKKDINELTRINFPSQNNELNLDYCVLQDDPRLIMEYVDRNDFVLFTDIWNKMSFSMYVEIKDSYEILPIRIKKIINKNKEDIIDSISDEYIYLITKNHWCIEKMIGFSVAKTLKNIGIKLLIVPMFS